MPRTIAANGVFTFVRLVTCLRTCQPFCFNSGQDTYCGTILGISREDGSGLKYNLDFDTMHGERLQVFVRCER